MFAIIKILFCLSILILSAFVQLPLFEYDSPTDKFILFNYSLTYLSCFLMSIAFRNNYAFVAVILYLLAGVCGMPIFAFGGGLSYIFEPGFAYLLGLVPLAIISFYYQLHCADSNIKLLGTNLCPLFGLLLAHVFGLLFLFVTFRLSFENFLNLAGMQLLYDLIFGYLALVFVKPRTSDIAYN